MSDRPESTVTSRPEPADRYLTDGDKLYRVIDAFRNSSGAVVGLEDCRSLEVILIPIKEFRALPLRPVSPATLR